ncbi:hypothetical protein L207DRAFT_531956 [Hyaloscypha variabilis F]|uniref:Uncharacterized protein n=1 Tax=Hyaloscypha variabilis (strain UAMH 11265 / GT02V1 / F) TaxID=1149755 RepID=A0A2J6RGQ6_HYAVF|nr:hypothetical protein L207DRAFT_531956 [Hyaloscypha variabilis F]
MRSVLGPLTLASAKIAPPNEAVPNGIGLETVDLRWAPNLDFAEQKGKTWRAKYPGTMVDHYPKIASGCLAGLSAKYSSSGLEELKMSGHFERIPSRRWVAPTAVVARSAFPPLALFTEISNKYQTPGPWGYHGPVSWRVTVARPDEMRLE